MSQVNLQGAPQFNPVDSPQIQGQPQAGHAAKAGSAQGQRITDIVNKAELLPYQQRRAERSTGQQVAYVLGRIAGAVLTLGTSELVIDWMHIAEKQTVDSLRQQALDRRAVDAQFNESLGDALRTGKDIPEHLQPGVTEAIQDLRTSFGDLVPENATKIADLPSRFSLAAAVSEAVKALPNEATVADVKSIIKEKAVPFLQQKAVQNALGHAFEKCGITSNPELHIGGLLKQIPRLQASIEGCQNRASLDAVVDFHSRAIERFAELLNIKKELRASTEEYAKDKLAQELKVSPEQLGRLLDSHKLFDTLASINEGFSVSNHPLSEDGKPNRAAMEASLREAADTFVEKKLALIRSVDELDISADLRIEWQSAALSERTYSSPSLFRNAAGAAQAMDTSKLAALFTEGGDLPTEDMVRARFETAGYLLEEKLVQMYGQESWDKLGGDGQGAVRYCAMQALIDRVPSLKEGLRQHPELLDAVYERAAEMSSAAFSSSGNEEASLVARTVASSVLTFVAAMRSTHTPLNAESLPLAYQQAMHTKEFMAYANFPEAKLPENIMEARLPSGQTMAEALNAALRASERPSSEQLVELADKFLHRCAAEGYTLDTIRTKAEAAGVPLSEEARTEVLKSLLEAYPDLGEELAQTLNEVMVLQSLVEVEGRMDALILEKQKPEFLKAALDSAVGTLAQNLGLSPEQVRTRMGGVVEALEKSLANFKPNAKPITDVPGLYAAEAQRLVQQTTAAYYAVEELGLSSQLTGIWKEMVLLEPSMVSSGILKKATDFADSLSNSMQSHQALTGNVRNAEAFYTALSSLGQNMERLGAAFFGEQSWSTMGPDGRRDVMYFSSQVLLGKWADLRDAMADNQGLFDALRQKATSVMAENMGTAPGMAAAFHSAVRSMSLIDGMAAYFKGGAQHTGASLSLDALPLPHLQSLQQAEAEVRLRFKDRELPEDLLSAQLIDGSKVGDILNSAMKEHAGRLSPEAFSSMAEGLFNRIAVDSMLNARLDALKESGTSEQDLKLLRDGMARRLPRSIKEWTPAKLENAQHTLEGLVRMVADVRKGRTEAEAAIVARFAELSSQDEEVVRKSDAMDLVGQHFSKLERSLLKSITDVADGEAGPVEEFANWKSIKASFNVEIAEVVSKYEAIGSLGVGDGLKAELKSMFFKDSKVADPGFLDKCLGVAQRIPAATFLQLMTDPDFDGQERYDVLRTLAREYNKALYGGVGQARIFSDTEVGSQQDRARIMQATLKIFLDQNPGLKGVGNLHDFHTRVVDLENRLGEEMDKVSAQERRLPPNEARRRFTDVNLELYFMEQLLLNMGRAVRAAREA